MADILTNSPAQAESKAKISAPPKAEPAGDFAAAKNAPPKPRRRFLFARAFLPLGAAAFSGAAIALLAAALAPVQFFPFAAETKPQAALWPPNAAGSAAQTAAVNALFAEKSRQLSRQTAEAAQILQDLTDKAAAAQQSGQQNNTETAAAKADWGSLSRRLDNQAREQAAERRADRQALSALQGNIALLDRHRQEILRQIAVLQQTVRVLSAGRQQAQRQTAQLLALQNLQNAFSSGAPYAAEMHSFNAVCADILADAPVSPLLAAGFARYQASGLPNKAMLARQFTQAAKQAAAAAEGEPASGFWPDMRRRLAKWVSVRPQGAAMGAAAGAVLARMETALAAGDDQAALAEAEALPEQMQAELRPYTDIMRLRPAADAFFRQTAQAIALPDKTAENSSAPAGAANPAAALRPEPSAPATLR